jgi:hypothetical protein
MSYTDYEIIKSEDGSHKALGDKLLSEYSSQELNSLPLNKRISYSIVVSSKIKEAQVHPTIEKIITDLTTKDRDIDEIILFVYSDKELVGNPYDVATAVWGKDGSLGKVSAEIAKSNDRTGYQITIQVKENLEEYLLQIGMSEEKFKLSEEERRQFYKELIATERQATIDADSKYPIDKAGVTKEEITKNTDFNYELTQKYTAELLLKYGITEDQSMEISMEAWDEGWSME